MLTAIIVDDEPAILDEMKDLLSAEKGIAVAGVYTEPLKALEEAKTIKPQCAFLDIELMGMSGIELAERLFFINPDMDIIFVTAYNNYGAQAFEVNAVDYLLKPVCAERLRRTLEKLQKRRKNICTDNNSLCTIRSFGGFAVYVGEHAVKWSRSKTKELFALLMQQKGKSITKYKLCELLWPEQTQEHTLAYLQTSMWSIRKSFRDMGFRGISIEYCDDRYLMKLDNVFWDVSEFERHYQAFKKSGSAEELKAALRLYADEYLEEEDWLWAYAERERCRSMYIEIYGNMRTR
jgi:two-component SAPR family response regulator